MKLILFVSVLTMLLLITCRRSHDKIDNQNVFNVSFDQCKDYIDLKLSDLIEECKLVSIETTEKSLLHQNPRILTVANYLIIGDRNGLYKFTNEGRFIKKLLNTGRGPFDIPQIYTSCVNEKNNQILFNDRFHNDDLFVYDYEAEKFLDPIKKSVPGYWGSFTVYNDSLILASLDITQIDTTSYELFLQNFKGQLLSSIKKGKKMVSLSKTETVQRLVICNGNMDTYVSYIYDDTLFRYNHHKLFPYFIVSYNTSRTFVRGFIPKEGESRVHFPSVDNNSFMLFPEVIFSSTTSEEMGGISVKYTQNYFFLNKTNGSFSRIRTYTDNITGKVQEGSGDLLTMSSGSLIPVIMQGDKLYVLYDASILKNIKANYELLREMPSTTTIKLHEILKNLDKMDNPVLLIGAIKTNIKIP